MKLNGTVSNVIIQPTKVQPIIVNFQNGKLRNTHATKMKCGLFYAEKCNKSVLGISNDHVVYKGHRPKNQSTYTMLAIHNKTTGKIRLIQAERWVVSPTIKNQLVYDENIEDDQNNLLNTQFGTKKVKRRTMQYGKMKISVDAVKDQLTETVAHVEIDKNDLKVEPIEDKLTSLPPCNRKAASAEEVYNLNDIIPVEILTLICEKYDDILQSDGNRKSRFYVDILKSLDRDTQKKKKMAILEFINGISKWLSMSVREAKRRSSEICVIPEVSFYIIDTYSMISASGRIRPMSMRDKAIIHSIILALMVNDYKLDLDSFNEHMTCRLSIKKLTELTRVIGAVPNKDNKQRVSLKVPLPNVTNVVKRMIKR
ncbi:uncharacterized protein LOC103571653 [Microplitis demolitor]|uniref:uncharacterized protein LOC103571653 n=1 Tax=Microplitis demolitor TaxID=69319 RepID=UPI00043FFE17|nr:uncharacterized protein LOC103571653 [Microplitis demolitor]